jgi:hypothetical protein
MMRWYHITGTIQLVPKDPSKWTQEQIERDLTIPHDTADFVVTKRYWIKWHRNNILKSTSGAKDVIWIDGPHFE